MATDAGWQVCILGTPCHVALARYPRVASIDHQSIITLIAVLVLTVRKTALSFVIVPKCHKSLILIDHPTLDLCVL